MPDAPQSDTPTPTEELPAGVQEFESRLAVFIGPQWESRYRKKLRPFLTDASFVPTWNWAAALATPFWFLYRKMYLWFALFFFAPQLALSWLAPDVGSLPPDALLKPENEQALLVLFGVQLSVHLAAGGVANWLLFRRASTAIRVVDMQPMATSESLQLLRRVGGVSRGLTFAIVALITVLSLAQVASMGVPG